MNLKVIRFMHVTSHMNEATKLTYKRPYMLVLHGMGRKSVMGPLNRDVTTHLTLL